MSVLRGLFIDDEFHAELFSALSQLMQHAFTVAFFVVVLALIGVGLAFSRRSVRTAHAGSNNRIRKL